MRPVRTRLVPPPTSLLAWQENVIFPNCAIFRAMRGQSFMKIEVRSSGSGTILGIPDEFSSRPLSGSVLVKPIRASKIRCFFQRCNVRWLGVAYGSDLKATRNILREAAKVHPAVHSEPEPAVLFTGFGDNSLNFELRCFLHDIGTILTTRSDLLFSICRALEKARIQIPSPQRDIHLSDIDRLVAAIADKRSDSDKKV